MSATDFYTGAAQRITVTHNDSTGAAIPHTSIDDVRYILKHENGDSLLKFRKVEPTDWTELTQEAAAGQYTLEITEDDSKEWPSGKVTLEWWIQITDVDYVDGFKPVGVEDLLNVFATNYAEQ